MIHLLIKIYLLSILGFYEYSLTNLFQIVNKVMLRTFHASSFFSNAYMIEYFSMNRVLLRVLLFRYLIS